MVRGIYAKHPSPTPNPQTIPRSGTRSLYVRGTSSHDRRSSRIQRWHRLCGRPSSSRCRRRARRSRRHRRRYPATPPAPPAVSDAGVVAGACAGAPSPLVLLPLRPPATGLEVPANPTAHGHPATAARQIQRGEAGRAPRASTRGSALRGRTRRLRRRKTRTRKAPALVVVPAFFARCRSSAPSPATAVAVAPRVPGIVAAVVASLSP
uniref:Uncharacterized protein n=1 Tax=Oryza glumipatula TaxID=40148 RepID=A0A0E0A2C4_9ORYZ